MASLNKVFLLGNLTRDPDLRYTPSGSAVCEFGLAVSRRSANGADQDEVCFVDIVVWSKQAENCKQYLAKGSPALIEGRLQFDQWEDRNGGGQAAGIRGLDRRGGRRAPRGGKMPAQALGRKAHQRTFVEPRVCK